MDRSAGFGRFYSNRSAFCTSSLALVWVNTPISSSSHGSEAHRPAGRALGGADVAAKRRHPPGASPGRFSRISGCVRRPQGSSLAFHLRSSAAAAGTGALPLARSQTAGSSSAGLQTRAATLPAGLLSLWCRLAELRAARAVLSSSTRRDDAVHEHHHAAGQHEEQRAEQGDAHGEQTAGDVRDQWRRARLPGRGRADE